MSDNEKRNEVEDETIRLEAIDVKTIEDDSAKINEPILPSLLHHALIVSDIAEVNKMASENSAIPLAEALNALTDNEVILFYSLVKDNNLLGEIFSYISVEERIALCENLPRKTIVSVLDCVVDDDLADFVEDLTKPLRLKVMTYLSGKRRKTIESLAAYSDDTIGSIMTTEYLAVPTGTLIKDVFKKIKEIGKTLETVRTVFVVDDKGNNFLLGTQRLENLMFEDENKKIDEVMQKDYAFISPIADKEEAIPLCKKYDLPVLPVVSKNGDLLGIITFDDVLDVIEAENTEDVYKSGAVTPTSTPYLETKAYRMAFSYVIWLIILLVINTFTSVIINKFESALLTLPVLVCFLPALNDTGGNSGDQTTSTITRALSTGEITLKDYWKVVGKEVLAGFITALIVAAFNFGWVEVELYGHLVNVTDAGRTAIAQDFGGLTSGYLIISMVVSVAIFFAVFMSKLLGANLPLLAKLCHIDPAIMSGPLIASLMDILTLLIYFSVAIIIIDHYDAGLIQSQMAMLPGLLA
jgi:magnesium transporter